MSTSWTEAEDKFIITSASPALWPVYPWLRVKRFNRQAGQYDYGVMIAMSEYAGMIFNLHPMPIVESPDDVRDVINERGQLIAMYDDVHRMLFDGWKVDR